MQISRFILVSILIHFSECNMQPFIVDGSSANIANFSYSALLQFHCVKEDLSDSLYICGSSILNQLITLTAGHCIFQCAEKSKVYAYVGHEGMYMGDLFETHSFAHHDDYDPQTVSNDIGIVRLKTALQFNSKISRIALLPDPPYDEEAVVAGWGMHDEVNGDFPYSLQYTTQNLMEKENCQKVMGKNIMDGTFCAEGKRGYPSHGDSGSPLVVNGYIQIGIVSFKMMNATPEAKRVIIYTDIGYFYKWIEDNVDFIACEV